MFTFWNYIILAVITVTIAAVTVFIFIDSRPAKATTICTILIEVILMGLLIVGCGAYNTHTETGKRALKSWDSEKSGGLQRTITVYDMQGEEVARYQGKFDIEESQNDGVVKVKFDIDGKRHIIYAQTGTVLIDEE